MIFLISRDSGGHEDKSRLQEEPHQDGVHANKVVKERIQRMEAGLWLAEVDRALADVKEANEKTIARRIQASGADGEELLHKNMEMFVHKTMAGDVRTGHRVLLSNGIHEPSDETVELMASKFVTGVRENVPVVGNDLKEKCKKCKAPKVSEEVVGKMVGNSKDCKASGVSGWRNSRLKAIAATPEGCAALTRWVNVWGAGAVPDHMASAWRMVLGILLRKVKTMSGLF